MLLLFAGLFAVASVLFSFVSWDVDQSILQKPAEERELLGNEVENLCGETGARLGRLLVDDSFGVFGILIPVMVALVGLRIIRQRPLLVNHSLLSLFLILILGSLTLGFAFGDNWSICCSTGWGGAFGIEVAAVLHARIGVFGTLILLLGGWILTGVFINRNFINKVNRAGNAMVDRSGRIVETVRRRVAGRMPLDEPLGGEEFRGTEPAAAEPSEPSGAHSPGAEKAVRERGASALRENVPPDAGEEEIAEAERRAWSAAGAARTMPQSHSGGTAAEHRPSEPFAVERAAAEPEAVRRTAGPEGASEVRISRPAGEEESPFVELTPDGEPLVPEKAAPAVPPAAEEEFTEVDLSRPDGRLVMGRGGLVELERPAVRRETVSDGPFTEITVGGGEAPAEDLRTLAERSGSWPNVPERGATPRGPCSRSCPWRGPKMPACPPEGRNRTVRGPPEPEARTLRSRKPGDTRRRKDMRRPVRKAAREARTGRSRPVRRRRAECRGRGRKRRRPEVLCRELRHRAKRLRAVRSGRKGSW